MENRYKYIAMENTLHTINGEYVSLPSDEMQRNNVILHELLDEITDSCIESNNLFDDLYRQLFYGGSYYEGLKITRPDEYDIHVKFYIPPSNRYRIISSEKSGYVYLKFLEIPNNGLQILINEDGYLDTERVLIWMHQILSTWLGGEKIKNGLVARKRTSYGIVQVKLERHGPAFTFRVTNFENILINFDFVPGFLFGKDQWPRGFRRYSNSGKCDYYIVAKPPKDVNKRTRYWRTSFQEQERALLYSKDKLKPALRLIKKLRDKLKLEHVIPSFFIKNIFLWEVLCKKPQFWNNPLSYIFMTMLKTLQRSIEEGEICYFWHKKFNLLENLDKHTLYDVNDKLRNIIIDIDNNLDDEFFISKFLLTQKELQDFRAKHRKSSY